MPSPPESETLRSEPAGHPTPSALHRRNQVLTALVGPEHGAREASLLRCDDENAVVGIGQVPVVLFTANDDGGLHLRRRFAVLLANQPTTLLFVVVVGGDGQVRAEVEAAAAQAHELRTLGVYHVAEHAGVSAASDPSWVVGRRSRPLEAALNASARLPPLSDAAIAAALQATRTGQAAESRFAAHLGQARPLVSYALIAACVSLFLIAQSFAHGRPSLALLRMGANVGSEVRAGAWWRLLASAFLHASPTHLFVNMLSLYFVGPFLERLLGSWRFLLLYGASALGGALASAFLHDDAASVGASGAIWGLMAAGFGLTLRPRGVLPPPVAARLRRAMTMPLVANLGLSFIPGIDRYAHFGGGAIGFSLALSGLLAWGLSPQGEGPNEPVRGAPAWVKVSAGLLLAAMVGSVGYGLAVGRPWQNADAAASEAVV